MGAKEWRAKDVAAVAAQHGYAFEAVDNGRIKGLPFTLFHLGFEYKVVNVMSGTARDIPFAAADYEYYVHDKPAGQGFNRLVGQLVVMWLAAQFPYLSVQRHEFPEKKMREFGLQPAPVGDIKFDQFFRPTTSDPEFTRALLASQVIEWFLTRGGGYWYEFYQGAVLVHCRQLPGVHIPALVDLLRELLDVIPPDVWSRYAAPST